MGIGWINAVSPGLWPNVWQSLWVAQAAPAAPSSSPAPMMIMLLTIGGLFYFMVLRPQGRDQKKREAMLTSVGKGDHVVTVGGLHGKVEAVDASTNQLSIQIAPKTVVRVDRSALASVTPKGAKGKEKQNSGKEDKA